MKSQAHEGWRSIVLSSFYRGDLGELRPN